ncbi:MAG: hypothetical protein HY236_17985 [Acidobacteria bacterium]|nr:hypothetical protein [Acidobacteriota bacterium]
MQRIEGRRNNLPAELSGVVAQFAQLHCTKKGRFSLLVGLAGALAATRLVSSALFGVKPTDPATMATAALIMIAVALVAGYAPARRAAGVDPVVALRHE